MDFERSPPSDRSAHLSFKVWDIGVSDLPSRDDDMRRVKDPHCSIGPTTANGDIPLPFLILTHLLYESGSPYIQLQCLDVEFQPFGKLAEGIQRSYGSLRRRRNLPWELVNKPANMTGMASTEARCALFIRFSWHQSTRYTQDARSQTGSCKQRDSYRLRQVSPIRSCRSRTNVGTSRCFKRAAIIKPPCPPPTTTT